jgi:hypothetical protein
MIGSSLRPAVVLVGGVCAAPLVVAQEAAEVAERSWVNDMHPAFMLAFPVSGMLFVLCIIGIALLHDRSMQRERLAAVERLVTAGHTVPRELITGEKPPLMLPEERRRDIRRGIAQLCWAIGIALFFYFTSGQLRAAAWGLLFLLPSLGNFFKAWLTAREIARGTTGDAR